jgi:protein phosphatase PTC1
VRQRKNEGAIGVEGDALTGKGGVTEAEAIVAQARKSIGEPEQSLETTAAEIMEEEEEKEPGPELNLEAAKAARKN